MAKKILIIFSILLASQFSFGKNQKSPKSYTPQILTQFEGVLWSFSFINENEVLLSLRKGELYHYNFKTKKKKKLDSPNVKAKGQGGLLDVHYVELGGQKFVYMTFSEKRKGSLTTALARGVYEDGSIKDLTSLFRARTKGKGGRHFGSRLVFKGNHIFMTVGDRGERKYAQDLSFHNGKILRLTHEGQPAPGNPFIKNKKALPEIWSYGHRNPQGIDIDPSTQEIYSIEFGPRGGDELNHIKKGENYGWPVITYGREYYGPEIGPTHKKGMQQPVTHWTPSISPSGMAFYSSNKLSKWSGSLFLAALGSEHLHRIKLNDGKVSFQEKLYESLNERIRHMRVSPDGLLYFSTDSGKLMRVNP